MCTTAQKNSKETQGSGGSRSPEPSYLVIGQVLRPHGVRGDLRVAILTDYPKRLQRNQHVYLASPASPNRVQQYLIEKVRFHHGVLLLKLANCEDRDAADELRGMLLQIPLEDAVPLSPGEFYPYQIVGLDVISDTGIALGRVVEVLETGANDVYVVVGSYGELLLPAIEDVILGFDLQDGQMTVHLIPGLMEDTL